MSHHGPSMHPLAFPTSAVFIYLFIFILFFLGGGDPLTLVQWFSNCGVDPNMNIFFLSRLELSL